MAHQLRITSVGVHLARVIRHTRRSDNTRSPMRDKRGLKILPKRYHAQLCQSYTGRANSVSAAYVSELE